MEEKLKFIEFLCKDLIKNAKIHMKNEEKTKGAGYWFSESHGNKNHGKTALKQEPTVDAVEVVRCKDCEHWIHTEDGYGDCTNGRFHLDGQVDPTMKMNDFCSCGERKEQCQG